MDLKELIINLIKYGNVEECKKISSIYFPTHKLGAGESQIYKSKDSTLELLTLIDDTFVLRYRKNKLLISLTFNTKKGRKKDNVIKYIEDLSIKVLNEEITVEELKNTIEEVATLYVQFDETESEYRFYNHSSIGISDYPSFTSIDFDNGNKIIGISEGL